MQGRKVALTGIGLITPFGTGNEVYWDGLMEGRSAVRPAEGFDTDGLPTTYVAQMPSVDYAAWLHPTKSALWGKVARIAVVASCLALEDAGLKELDARRTGVFLGTGYGGNYELEQNYVTWIGKGWRRLKPTTVPRSMANAAATLELDPNALRTSEIYLASGDVESSRKNREEALRRLSSVLAGRVHDALDRELIQ
ncbi:MAG: beta-ketoacyl synthase N-terminal-like domain-containing protein [Planctomycetota bacterium]